MYYRIVDIDVAKNDRLYVVAEFWLTKFDHDRGIAPVVVEEFLMDVIEEGSFVIEDAEGRRRVSGGEWEIPYEEINGYWVLKNKEWERETWSYSIINQVHNNLIKFHKQIEEKRYRGDMRSSEEFRVPGPHRLKQRADVKGAVGKGYLSDGIQRDIRSRKII